MLVLRDVTLAKAIDIMLSKKATEAEIADGADKIRYEKRKHEERLSFNGSRIEAISFSSFRHERKWTLTIHKSEEDTSP
jgi:RecB family endonuclease NucS